MDSNNDILDEVFKWCILALCFAGVIFDFGCRLFIIAAFLIVSVCAFIQVIFIDKRKGK